MKDTNEGLDFPVSLESYLSYLGKAFCDRPHDRVPLKEMKADWQSYLDNKVGFKVSPSYSSLACMNLVSLFKVSQYFTFTKEFCIACESIRLNKTKSTGKEG